MGTIQQPIWTGKCPMCNNPKVNDVYCHICGTQLIAGTESGGSAIHMIIFMMSVMIISIGVSFLIAAFTESKPADCPNLGIAENCKAQKGDLTIMSTTEGTTFTCVVKK